MNIFLVFTQNINGGEIMNNKEFKKKTPFENDMKKKFYEDTEFGKEFINPFDELEMTLKYTNGTIEKSIINNRQIKHKK